MYRIINPQDPTPTFVADTEADLALILADPYHDEQGSAAIVLETGNIYLMDSSRKWVKI